MVQIVNKSCASITLYFPSLLPSPPSIKKQSNLEHLESSGTKIMMRGLIDLLYTSYVDRPIVRQLWWETYCTAVMMGDLLYASYDEKPIVQ